MGGVQGWTNTGTGNVITYFPPSSIFASVPDGNQIAVFGDFGGSADQNITQTFTTAWAANTTYNLTFYVGKFPSSVLGYAGYIATLSDDSGVLATDENQVNPPGGGFLQDTLTFTTGATAPAGNITVEFADPGIAGGVAFDLVQLTSTSSVSSAAPEPEAWALVLCGIGLIGAARWRRLIPARRCGDLTPARRCGVPGR